MEQYQLTPGAERALEFSGAWEVCEESSKIHPVELICGLMAEPECRAAILITAQGIDEAAVQAHWPTLRRRSAETLPRPRPPSAEVNAALRAAQELLFEYPQPVTLATEHLLLGLAATPGDVSSWLAERGLHVGELEAEIHRLAGHQPGPLPLDFDMPDELDITSTALSPAAPSVAELPSGAKTPLPGGPVIDSSNTDLSNSGLSQTGLWRALDAAANRAGEGLRVVEDYVRFVLDDRHLTAACKQLRHDLTAALARLPAAARYAARDVVGDVGTEITTSSEQRRADPRDVAEASCKRAQQALRSLEEFSKALDPAVAQRFERLRYRSYTLERAIDVVATSLVRLAAARLYVLIDGQASTGAFRGAGRNVGRR